jgi:3-methylcrotonyl-CoA carboxylase alpha subunit
VSDVKALGDGRFLLTQEERTSLAYAVTSASGTWVFVDGHVYLVDAPARPGPRHARVDDQSLAAPMPATVVSIDVAPGQSVSAGDTLILLEAMKMELAIKAPRDSRVARIACTQGELVQPGIPLVELE